MRHDPRVRLVGLAARESPAALAGGAAGVVASAVAPNLFRASLGATVAAVASGHRVREALIALLAAYVFQQATPSVAHVLQAGLGMRVDRAAGREIASASLRPAGIAHLEDPRFLDALARARGIHTGYSPATAIAGLAELAGTRLAGAGAALLVARFDVAVAVVLVLTWRVARRWLLASFMESYKLIGEQAHMLRRASYVSGMDLTRGAAKEIRVFGWAPWLSARFASSWTEVMDRVWAARRASRPADAASLALILGVHAVAYAALGARLAAGDVALGLAAVVATSIPGVAGLGSSAGGDLNAELGLASVRALDELRAFPSPATLEGRGAPARSGSPHVRFEAVAFTYPGASRPALSRVDLEIPAATSLAIVGVNGAGKTTLVKLLARLHDPDSGRILVDGEDLGTLEARAWRERLVAIFQDYVHYPFTLRDNVGFGGEPAERAARLAGLDEVVRALPRGWDTVLSRRYTGGAELSEGQWQRVALARALAGVLAGAGLVVLDEPTASLDVRAEAETFDRVLDAVRGTTTLLISHRFSTVRRADRIAVLADGTIVEQGTHAGLMRRDGLYASMFRLQAEMFDAPA